MIIFRCASIACTDQSWRGTKCRGGYRLTKVNFFHVYPQNPLLWSIIRLPIWKFWNFREKKTPNRPNYFLDFPIIGPKKKVVVNFIYGYQTLSGEKCKSNGKRISSIRHTSEEKNPKNHPKIPFSTLWLYIWVLIPIYKVYDNFFFAL